MLRLSSATTVAQTAGTINNSHRLCLRGRDGMQKITLFFLILIVATLYPSVSPHAQLSQHWMQCEKKGRAFLPDVIIDSCTVVISSAKERPPKLASAYLNRGVAYYTKGDYDRAITDYSRASELDPKNADLFRQLGVAQFNNGNFKAASTELLRSIELKDDIYAMLFRYVARARAGETIAAAELEANAGRLKTKEWPYAVIELYLGRRTPELALDAAGTPDHRCEAQFYIGQWQIMKGNSAEAAASLKEAVDTCPRTFIEYASAVAELKRLQP